MTEPCSSSNWFYPALPGRNFSCRVAQGSGLKTSQNDVEELADQYFAVHRAIKGASENGPDPALRNALTVSILFYPQPSR